MSVQESKGLTMPSPFSSGQWHNPKTSYQIMVVEPIANENDSPCQKVKKTLCIGQKGDPSAKTNDPSAKTNDPSAKTNDFSKCTLDKETIEKLHSQGCLPYPKDKESLLSSYLPSPGVVLKEEFIQALSGQNDSHENPIVNAQVELNNFYDTTRTLLHTRKISQLIARTWDAYVKANKDKKLWEQFKSGEWHSFSDEDLDENSTIKVTKSDILDGLIAREIFLSIQSEPDDLVPDNLADYYPLKSNLGDASGTNDNGRFVILPSSRSWQGISLSLLLAGQVYRKVGDLYHQITQPILSTGEIVNKYHLEVSWDQFKGDIKELAVGINKPSNAYEAIIPYPPIPSEQNLSPDDIERWAFANDQLTTPATEQSNNPATEQSNKKDYSGLEFYSQDSKGHYLVGVKHHSPPYPYLPLSCT